MATITVHGEETPLLGKEQKVGSEAPAARIKKLDGSSNVIGMIQPTVQLLIAIPSLKTEVCSLGAKKFNDLIKEFNKLQAIMVTTDDLEFVDDFAKRENIDAAEIVIDEDREFAKKYGLLIDGGKLNNRLARAVYVVDRDGIITYKQIVPEIVDEVDYDACIAAVAEIANEVKTGHTHEEWMSV